ncbi:MAG: glycerol-3-phosphate dehydrogenase subunit GlpB [Desulfatitalea sp.]|nr:glycerol-3-phosphate dehydrogenase subunit GlpB [Desulfatitalea sp.]NNJ99114.1 glycerol-3-phosphate dehydrogenase subunit GlpB [Desulfatitalea sp.]
MNSGHCICPIELSEKAVTCDLFIIGSGMAGMSAALFAARKGIDTVLVGLTSEMGFASGVIDLLGIHPVATATRVEDPWQGIKRLCRDEPRHPYARLALSTIEAAVTTLLDVLAADGYPYTVRARRNQTVVTPVGTLKSTYALPHTMAHGPTVLSDRQPCLLVDFPGLKGYSARQIVTSLAGHHGGFQTLRIPFPGNSGECYPEQMARALDTVSVRRKLAAALGPHVGAAAAIGLPAVLGMYRTQEVMADLQAAVGVPIFEIPTMLPSVPGLRLREIFQQRLPAMGVRTHFQNQVTHAQRLTDGRWCFVVAPANESEAQIHVLARSAVLCSGRFFGKGLHADRHGIRETVFNLSVMQPKNRADWHHKDVLHQPGHPVNRAGIAVDELFRPVNDHGQPVYSNLFAAGSILAHQDWMRQKCGGGLAIATAYGAIDACTRGLG